jgi:hypothetical protein
MKPVLTSLVVALLAFSGLIASAYAGSIEDDFRHPPRNAKPWVYWVWLRTPTTPAAMTRDLEEMKAKGIVGFILYDNGAGTLEKNRGRMVPATKAFVVDPTEQYKGEYMTPLPVLETWSPQWREEIRFVASEARRLGLDFCLSHGLAGCSAPGLDPHYAQQMLDFTKQDVTGPEKFDGILPLPKPKRALRDKAGELVYSDVAVVAIPVQGAVRTSDVQDLTGHLDGKGRLHWDVPAGQWRIIRFIQRPTGASNVFGLFCDTLSPEGIEQDWALTMAPLLKEMTPDERRALIGVEDDSWESGPPTWTKTFPVEFKARRGYSLIDFLPALAGETINDAATTERFKRDYAQTISDLIVTNYYAHMESICRQNGLTLYDEANGPHLHYADISLTPSKVDQPMAEFWMPSVHRPTPASRFLSRDAATANHLFGKPITMCEAFTSLGPIWEETPFSMKACADQAFCDGTNRLCFHNYSHSPSLDDKPGDVYAAGTHINRNITWWEQFPAFNDYLSRCCALLQDGSFVADALFEIGDGINRLQPTKIISPQLGPGYDYDRASADALIQLADVKNGRIVVPSGMSYRVLILPDNQPMRLDALQKIASLAQAGATIVGPRPTAMEGLSVHADDETQFANLVNRLWGDATTKPAEIAIGAGRVVTGKTAEEVLQTQGVGPDFEYQGLSAGGEVAWIHRATGDADWYFVTSRWFAPEKLTCTFRVTGKQPELWDPVSGEIRDAVAFTQNKGRTTIPLEFGPCGSVFVVFRRSIAPSVGGSAQGNYPSLQPMARIDGPWTVAFDPKWGGPPAPVTFDTLTDWTERPEDEIKYYSGSALYTKSFDLPALPPTIPPGHTILLDLGTVHEVASVRLNGHDLGVVWTQPARVDITSAIKPTANMLEIKVVNLWPNRLIGDSFLPADRQFTHTNVHHFTQSSSLLPSGLMGPVNILDSQLPEQ